MVVRKTENETKKFSISYINKNEATFILGLLRHVNCSHCVDFYQGCGGGLSLQENAALNDQEYQLKHVAGTESFLCGKLRNIISLTRAEEQDIQNQFEGDFNKKISLIAKKGDDEKYVLIPDKDEFNSVIKSMEKQMVEKIQRDVDQINRHNVSIVQNMQEKISLQESQMNLLQQRIAVQEEMLQNKEILNNRKSKK